MQRGSWENPRYLVILPTVFLSIQYAVLYHPRNESKRNVRAGASNARTTAQSWTSEPLLFRRLLQRYVRVAKPLAFLFDNVLLICLQLLVEADEEVESDNSLFTMQRIDKNDFRRFCSKELFGELKSTKSFIQLSNIIILRIFEALHFFSFFFNILPVITIFVDCLRRGMFHLRKNWNRRKYTWRRVLDRYFPLLFEYSELKHRYTGDSCTLLN